LSSLRKLIAGNELIVAPVALNPIMARLAEAAGFKAVYLSGGSLGWYKGITEANITMPELAQVAVDMRTVCKLPIVLDAGGGFGDPVHMHRTIALAEAAGFAAIEIEDQLLPRRFEHHAGIDHLVPTEFMLKKLAEAFAARSNADLVIIARTNARRVGGLDDALRRGEAFHKAGADMLFVYTRGPEEMRIVGERLPPPLMTFAPPDGFPEFPLSPRDLAGLGFRLAASSGTAFAAMYKAVKQSYECLAQGKLDPFLGRGGAEKEMKVAQETCDFPRFLDIERRTMRDSGRTGS
jgi:methylisocitrate lyase